MKPIFHTLSLNQFCRISLTLSDLLAFLGVERLRKSDPITKTILAEYILYTYIVICYLFVFYQKPKLSSNLRYIAWLPNHLGDLDLIFCHFFCFIEA